MELPDFSDAAASLQEFLASHSRPTSIVWAFAEDYYTPSVVQHWVRWPLPRENEELARGTYAAGRTRGLVELCAQFHTEGFAVATVFAPRQDQIQGWSAGLRLAIREPWVEARAVRSRARWWWHRHMGRYRHWQAHQELVARRADVAVAQRSVGQRSGPHSITLPEDDIS